MKLFLSSMIQETNTFSEQLSDISLFETGYIYRGEEVREGLKNTNTEVCGFLEYFDARPEYELSLGYFAWSVAAGPLVHKDYLAMLDEIMSSLKRSLPVDGVLLAFHGALVSTKEFDCEGYALEKIREVVGPDVPIACSFDYHANVTKKIVQNADAVAGYQTFPHVDFKETGIRAARALEIILKEKIHPYKVFEKCPLVVPCEDSTTDYGIAKYLVDEVKKLEADGTALAATFFCMQPLLDINEVGNSFVFYAENEEKAEILKKKAKELAKTMMARKEEFFVDYDGIEAVMLCLPQMEKPTIFIDSGDVLTGGAVGDSTVMIRSFLKHKFPYTYAVNLVDKKVVDKTRTMKEGEFAEFELGVSDDPDAYNAKIRVRAQYLRSSESKITFKGKSFFGLQINPGRRALLCIENSVYVIVCEHTAMLYDPEVLRDVGLEPKEFSVIVQKAHNLFKPAYKNIAKTIVNVDTLGATNQNIKSRPFKNINHPVYPFDSL